MVMFRKALGLLILCGVAVGNESAVGDNTVAFEDSFERSELGDRWLVVTPSFSIHDGRLVGHEEPDRNHVAVSRVPLAFRNGIFEFSFRLTDGKNINFVINDKNYKQAHAGHICRVAISSSLVRISDDREGAFRKDLYKAFLESGRNCRRTYLKDAGRSLGCSQEFWKLEITRQRRIDRVRQRSNLGGPAAPGESEVMVDPTAPTRSIFNATSQPDSKPALPSMRCEPTRRVER